MGSDMVFDKIWGFPSERIREYLEERGAETGSGVYSCAGCVATVEALPDRRIGNIFLPQTRVRMEGPGAEAFHHEFLLRFLSGGG